jgi:hypothetical protein
VDSPVGKTSADFTVPFSDKDLKIFILTIGRTRSGVRKIDSPQMTAAREFGGALYDAVFAGMVGEMFQRSIDEAERDGKGIRLRLHVSETSSSLYELPWEFLYSRSMARFLVLSTDVPLVRFIDLPQKVHSLAVAPPLRVLVVVPSPADVTSLDVQGELALLDEATAQQRMDRRLELHPIEHATFDALRKRLKQGNHEGKAFHVLHFIGHGGFDGDQGVLLFEDEYRRRRLVTGHDLAMILHGHPDLRLVVLNACEGARTSRQDSFGGVAQSLVRQGIPAVIAMQFEVTDNAAKVFADEFYTSLCEGQPVDAACAEARRAVFTTDNDVEWATPVLYMRAPDGHIFDVGVPPLEASHPPPPPPAGCDTFVVGTPLSNPKCFFGRYHEVRRLLQKLRASPLQNAAIVGPKRSGKTSLLRHLRAVSIAPLTDLRPGQQTYARQGFEAHRWIYADFQDPQIRTRQGLLRHLLRQIDGRETQSPVDLDTFFGSMVEQLDRPTVVLLDEVGVALGKYSQEFDDVFWDAMRALASSDAGHHLAFVLAMHAPPYEIATTNEFASPFFNIIGYTATLGPLTEEEALELVNNSVIPFPPADVEWIINQSGRWPILLQTLCSERLTALQEDEVSDIWRERGLAQMKQYQHLLT